MQPALSTPFDAVVIGASAGGVDALLHLLRDLPADYPLPILAVLHLPEDRASLLSAVFAERLAIEVREPSDKEPLRPGVLYFAPPAYHLSVEADATLSLSCEAPVHFSRPSIDVLFESAALALAPRLLAVLLTGANGDGAAGLAAVGAAGGTTVVQDPAEARSPTMPKAAIARRPPGRIARLDGIRQLLADLGPAHAS